jgi:predicted secreted protein
MKSKDKRKKKIVYISSCILNQNLRFPGIAIKGGAVVEIIELLLKNKLGIEQLPCLERMGWGGVSRRKFLRLQPIAFKFVGSSLFLIINFFFKIWIFKFSRLCKKEAFKVVDQMEDYINSSYSILGIIAMNDSPTCGATRTIDLLKSASKYKNLGFKTEDLENPELEKMRIITPSLCEEGSGLFMIEVMKELSKRGINIKVIGFDPWYDLKKEAERIANILNLKI